MAEREIDGCKVELVLEREVVRWDDVLKACLRFRGGPTATRFTRIEVRLHLTSMEGQVAVLDRPPLTFHELEIAPNHLREHPFELAIPSWAGLGAGAAVVLVIHRRRSWIPVSMMTPLCLVPFRCFTDVLELSTRITGFSPEDWRTGSMGDGVRIRLVAPAGAKRIASITLELHRANGVQYGTLILEPVAAGLSGALKRFADADDISLPIRFREGDLEGAAIQLTALLRPYLDESRQLPIPATYMPQPEELPIPAGPSATSSESLPRPVFPEHHGDEPKWH